MVVTEGFTVCGALLPPESFLNCLRSLRVDDFCLLGLINPFDLGLEVGLEACALGLFEACTKSIIELEPFFDFNELLKDTFAVDVDVCEGELVEAATDLTVMDVSLGRPFGVAVLFKLTGSLPLFLSV